MVIVELLLKNSADEDAVVVSVAGMFFCSGCNPFDVAVALVIVIVVVLVIVIVVVLVIVIVVVLVIVIVVVLLPVE